MLICWISNKKLIKLNWNCKIFQSINKLGKNNIDSNKKIQPKMSVLL